MKIKRFSAIIILLLAFSTSALAIDTKPLIGIVNFMTCITDSKYGKNEQEQLENIKKQWSSLIEETEKELKETNAKFDDQDYLDSLSPEAEEQLKAKQQTLNQDIAKYQNQLYQLLNQAQYFFIQKMSTNISKASETIAKDKKLDIVLNKEACFYNNPKIDITDLVIKEMDKNYEKDASKNEKPKESLTQAEIKSDETLAKKEPVASENIAVQKEIATKKEPAASENIAVQKEIATKKEPAASENIAVQKEIATKKEPVASENIAVQKEIATKKEPAASENIAVQKEIVTKKEPEVTIPVSKEVK